MYIFINQSSGAKCIELESQDEVLGYFNGSMPELLDLIKDVQKGISNQMHEPLPKRGPVEISKRRERSRAVPCVCVCVEGGANTIHNTVLSAAKNGTSSLLIKGSGRAACLMSDAVLLKDFKSSPKVLDSQQQALAALMVEDLRMKVDKKKGSYDYKDLKIRLEDSEKLLQAWKKEKYDSLNWDDFRSQHCPKWSEHKKDNAPLSEALRVEWLASLVVQKYIEKAPFCVTEKLRLVFQAADTGKCKVP
jgi:hypothetical protein